MPIKELGNQGPVIVTVTDESTGAVIDTYRLADDFAVITQGKRYVKSWQMWGQTFQCNIAKEK